MNVNEMREVKQIRRKGGNDLVKLKTMEIHDRYNIKEKLI